MTEALVILALLVLIMIAVYGMNYLGEKLENLRYRPKPDPALDLRRALLAERLAKREEHMNWEAEFCALLGVRVPTNGDVYNLTRDMVQLEIDIERLDEKGEIVDSTTVLKYTRGWASGGVLHALHRDHPECGCNQCLKARVLFIRKSSENS